MSLHAAVNFEWSWPEYRALAEGFRSDRPKGYRNVTGTTPPLSKVCSFQLPVMRRFLPSWTAALPEISEPIPPDVKSDHVEPACWGADLLKLRRPLPARSGVPRTSPRTVPAGRRQ